MSSADDPNFGLGYALAAYAVIFVVFFGYVGWLQFQQARLRRELAELRRHLDESASRRAER